MCMAHGLCAHGLPNEAALSLRSAACAVCVVQPTQRSMLPQPLLLALKTSSPPLVAAPQLAMHDSPPRRVQCEC